MNFGNALLLGKILDTPASGWGGSAAVIVIKYSGLAIGFGPFLGENLWQLSRLA